MNVYPRPSFPHLARALRARVWQRCRPHLAFLLVIALTTLVLVIGTAHAQEKQIVTYGPWQGYWQQARLSAYSPHDALDREYHESKGARWRFITADGKTDVRDEPYGIAASSQIGFGTRIFIPGGHGYLDQSRTSPHDRCFSVDDRGSAIEHGSVSDGRVWLDLRYRTEFSALAFGVKDAWVFIITSTN